MHGETVKLTVKFASVVTAVQCCHIFQFGQAKKVIQKMLNAWQH